MPNHVALLRGMNVGRGKRVSMADLKSVVEGLGFGEVSTLLNSGNVVFSATAAAGGKAGARIERALAEKLELTTKATVLSAKELAEIVDGNPLLSVARNPSRLLVAVLRNPADRPKLVALGKQSWAPESLAVGKRCAYLWMPDGVAESQLAKALEKSLRDEVTSRNWSTTLKLHARMG